MEFICARIFPSDERARAVWRACLAAALRTAAACAAVGIATLYGPASLRSVVGFPAFSYVTVILVVTDASLGDTLRSCWLALYASAQSLGPAALSLWLIGPARMTRGVTALAVALGAFVVALPESTQLVAKRIALGQIVLVYVIGFINGDKTEPIMHPLRLAASTGLGIFACVLALLLPFPRLACKEVKHNCQQFTENALERLKNLVKAFCAEDKTLALESISQAKSLASAATKLIQTVKRFQESMKWERPPLKCLKAKYFTNPGDKMQQLEVPLRGLEMALINTTCSFPIRTLPNEDDDQELKNGLLRLVENNMINLSSGIFQNDVSLISTDPESTDLQNPTFQQKLPHQIPTETGNQFLGSMFFLFCMKLVLHVTKTTPISQRRNVRESTKNATVKDDDSDRDGFSFRELIEKWMSINSYNSQRLTYAFKCSLSLGLAVYFGLAYSKPDGFWAGLPVAISLSAGREATFRVSNLKAQGTMLGTVYGVLVWFVFSNSAPARLVSLLPWLVFTSFLQRSKMYGQAGAISAVIGAILVLGRKGFGPPSDFAVARIVETFIGLSCSVAVDLLLNPARASTLSKARLSNTLEALHDCVGALTYEKTVDLVDKRKKLRACVGELGQFVGEAESEPNFWFLPFPVPTYGKLLKSLSKMADLVEFSARAMEFLDQQEQSVRLMDGHDDDIEVLKELVCSSVKCLEEITRVKSLAVLEKEVNEKSAMSNDDIEMGKSKKKLSFLLSDDEIDKVLSSYMLHSRQVVETIKNEACEDDGEERKRQMVLGLSALGFCLKGLVRETREIEAAIKELVKWENPSRVRLNLNEIYCMINALNK